MLSDHAEAGLLKHLDNLVLLGQVRKSLDEIVARVCHSLDHDAKGLMAWEPVPLDIYGDALPLTIRSSWVFVLRRESATGAERHPNSIQRVVSYWGSGDLQIKTALEDEWSSHVLASDPALSVERRCLSIPTNVWHQAVVPNRHWAVVSFHTAETHELIEERPDLVDATRYRQSLYVVESLNG